MTLGWDEPVIKLDLRLNLDVEVTASSAGMQEQLRVPQSNGVNRMTETLQATKSTYRTQNPTTGEIVETFNTTSDAEIETVLAKSQSAYETWSARPMSERGAILHKVADLFDEKSPELARIAAEEMGKPIIESKYEIAICSQILRYYADEGEKLTQDQEIRNFDGTRAVIQRLPLGPLLGVMPWNFPYYQIIRFAAPNLMLGNTIVMKPANICAASALILEEMMREAGVPEGAYQTVFTTHDQISEIIADPRIHGISLTGSERAGSIIAEQAGRHLKKVVLELGGSDPYIILSSDDIARAARRAMLTRIRNTGQECASNKRIIVMDDIYDEFVTALVAEAEALTPGDPLNPERNNFFPVSSEAAANEIVAQVQDAADNGATVHTGGKRLDRPGYYVSPAVITNITKDARAYYEEIFGPVAMVYRVSSEEEAVALANDSQYGLGGAVYSADTIQAERVANQLNVGMSHVNAFNVVGADLPFGGVKRSGYGRELGPLGMDEFVNKRLFTVTEK